MPREDDGLTIVGRNPVREALADLTVEVEKVLLRQGISGGAINDIRRAAKERGVPVQFVPAVRLDRAAGGANHQGVAAVTSPVRYLELHDLMAMVGPDIEAVRQTRPLLLLLDGVQDPHNYGAILRSAVAAGAAGVIIPRHGMAPISAVTMKASAGTAGRVPIARVGNLADVLYSLKERGFWIAGAAGDGETSLWDMDWERPVALVIGGEGRGLGRRVAEGCDYLVRIPMSGDAESLNASVAAGVLMFAAARTRLS